MIILKFCLFFLILFLFGWVFSIFILKERRWFVLIPVSFSLGISFYIILVNAIAYFVPVNTTFYLVLFLFLVLGVLGLFFYYRRPRPPLTLGLGKKYFKYLMLIAVIIALTGWLINVPLKEGDNIGFGRAAVPGTILGGNFPIRDILAPWRLGINHYAFQLLSAAVDRVSGLPFWFADDIQTGIFAGLIFLLAFVLIYKIIKNEFIALWGSVLFFFCSGLNVFYIFKGAIDLFKRYILGEQVFAVWQFVGTATEFWLRPTLMGTINLRWAAVALPAVLLIIYFYFEILESRSKKETVILSVLTGVLLGSLSLSGEVYLVIIAGVIGVATFLFIVFEHRNNQPEIFRHILAALIILAIGLIMFLYQGGVFTSLKAAGNTSKLSLNFDVFESIRILRPEYFSPWCFFEDIFLTFGLGLFLLIPAIIYFRKNRQILFFIVPLIIIPIFPLLFARFPVQSFERGLYLTEGFGYLLSGLLIIKLMLGANRKEKIILYFFFLTIISGGVIFQVFNTARTLAMTHREVFFPQPPAIELIDTRIKEWIDTNTTIDDYFFTEIDDNLFLDLAGERKYDFTQNLSFITYYGRLAPVISLSTLAPILDVPSEWIDSIKEAKTSCSRQSLKELGIKYIYFTTQWPKGLMEQCIKNNSLELVFQSGDNKIYKILNR